MPQFRIFGTPTLGLLASGIAPVDTPSPDLERLALIAESDRATIHLAIYQSHFLVLYLMVVRRLNPAFPLGELRHGRPLKKATSFSLLHEVQWFTVLSVLSASNTMSCLNPSSNPLEKNTPMKLPPISLPTFGKADPTRTTAHWSG